MPTPILKSSTNTYLVVFDLYHLPDFDAVSVLEEYSDNKRYTDNVFFIKTTDQMETINKKLNKTVDIGAVMIMPAVQPYFSTPQGPVEDWLDHALKE